MLTQQIDTTKQVENITMVEINFEQFAAELDAATQAHLEWSRRVLRRAHHRRTYFMPFWRMAIRE